MASSELRIGFRTYGSLSCDSSHPVQLISRLLILPSWMQTAPSQLGESRSIAPRNSFPTEALIAPHHPSCTLALPGLALVSPSSSIPLPLIPTDGYFHSLRRRRPYRLVHSYIPLCTRSLTLPPTPRRSRLSRLTVLAVVKTADAVQQAVQWTERSVATGVLKEAVLYAFECDTGGNEVSGRAEILSEIATGI